MKADNALKLSSDRVWPTEEACDLEDFEAIVERSTNRADYPPRERSRVQCTDL